MMSSASFWNKIIAALLLFGVILSSCGPWARKQEEPPKIYDTKAMELFIEATIAEELEDYYRAIVLYQEALRRDSTAATIHLSLAALHQHLGQLESALNHLDAAAKLSPDDQQIGEWIIELLGSLERWDEQMPYVQRLLKIDSNNLTYNLQLANIYLQAGNHKTARKVFRKVINLADENKDILQRLGVMLLLNDEPELAERCFYLICQIDPVDDQAQFTLGRIYATLGKDRDAQKRFEMAVAINDTVLRYWTNLAFIDVNAERHHQAELILRRALDKLPDNPILLNLLGSSLERQDLYDEALDILYRSASLDTNSVAPYITIGFVYDETDRFEMAESTYKKALEIDSVNATVLNNYAYLLATRGIRLDEALTMSEQSLEQTPDNPSYLDTIGWIHFQMGNPSQALEYLLKAEELTEDNGAELYDHLGDVYWEMNEHQKAKDYWKRALKNDPSNENLRLKIRQPASAQN